MLHNFPKVLGDFPHPGGTAQQQNMFQCLPFYDAYCWLRNLNKWSSRTNNTPQGWVEAGVASPVF